MVLSVKLVKKWLSCSRKRSNKKTSNRNGPNNCTFWDASEKFLPRTEEFTWRCSTKKIFWKISQNSQENTCVGVSFWSKIIFLISKHILKSALSDLRQFVATASLLTLFRIGGSQKAPPPSNPYQFFPCNFCKCRN